MRAHAILPLTALFLGLAAQAAAQRVDGIVLDESTGTPIPGAQILVQDAAGTVLFRSLTNEDGRFFLSLEGLSEIVLSVSRLGYQAFTSEAIPVDPRERVDLEIRLGIDAIPLEALVVTERSRRYPPDIQAFYDRLERGRRAGDGTYFSRSEIDRLHASRSTDILRGAAGVQIVRGRRGSGDVARMRGGCIPSIYIDGAYMNRYDTHLSLDDYVAPLAIEGIEIYRGAGRMVQHMNDPRGCGLILVWTQRGERTGGTGPLIRWRTLGAIVLVFGAILFLGR